MAQVDAADWNRLAGEAYPFMRHEFLWALEHSGSVCEQNRVDRCAFAGVGLTIKLVAVMPLYLKSHSWGEYVLITSGRRLISRQGVDYYPKWLTAIPLTALPG